MIAEATLNGLGVGGIFVMLVLRMVFEFIGPISRTKNNGNGRSDRAENAVSRLSDMLLHQSDRKSLDEAIVKLAINIDKQTQTLREMTAASKSDHSLILTEMKEMRRNGIR